MYITEVRNIAVGGDIDLAFPMDHGRVMTIQRHGGAPAARRNVLRSLGKAR
jgi:hypothetical protein